MNSPAMASMVAPTIALSIALSGSGCVGSAARIEAFKTGTATTRASAALRRGINFGDAQDAPNEGEWGWTLSAADFKTAREAGFDHVRVPMRVSAHAGRQPPYKIEGRFVHRMDWAIAEAPSNDLAIIVDLHHSEEKR